MSTKTKEQLEQEIRDLNAKIAKAKQEKKALEPRKGSKIKFQDKDGKWQEAYGVLYYYCDNFQGTGKTVVKKADLCQVIS